MANPNRPHGFQPVSYLNGAPWNNQVRLYYIPQADTNAYYPGDPVKTQAGASTGMAAGQKSVGAARVTKAAGADTVRGVAVAFGVNPANPSESHAPAVKRGSYLVEVVDDPMIIFEVQGDNAEALDDTVVGKLASFNVAVPAADGITSASTLNTASIADDGTLPLRILGLAGGDFGPYCRFLVCWNLHELSGGSSSEVVAVLGDQSANTVYAGPTEGADAAPTFRSLVEADIADLVASLVGTTSWMRFTADGTKRVGTSDLSVSRVGIGRYLCTSTVEYDAVDGHYNYSVVPSPSAAAGNGGDGVSPFLAFSDAVKVDTDQYTGGDLVFFYSPSTASLYALGPDSDVIFVHDTADFTATPTEIDAVTPVAPPDTGNSGCISREGDFIWLSATGSATGSTVRALEVATGTVTDFTNTGNLLCVAAFTDSGTKYVMIYDGSSTISLYAPNFGTPALGSAVSTWTVNPLGAYCQFGAWDETGAVWFCPGTNLVRIDPLVGTDFDTHAYPAEVGGTPAGGGSLVYDTLRNRFYVQVGGASENWLYTFASWVPGVDDSGQFLHFGSTPEGFAPLTMWHDPTSDVLFVPNEDTGLIHRFLGTGLQIDVLDFGDETTWTHQSSHSTFYADGCGYVYASYGGGTRAIARLCYAGAELTIGGTGAGFISGALIADHEIISGTQFYINVYREQNPSRFADAGCSVHLKGIAP